jgi:hypothetical protein
LCRRRALQFAAHGGGLFLTVMCTLQNTTSGGGRVGAARFHTLQHAANDIYIVPAFSVAAEDALKKLKRRKKNYICVIVFMTIW